MSVLKICLSFIFLTAFAVQAQAESISKAAAKISKAREKRIELEKNQVKIGETITEIGDLSIEDFLELEAVPDGMDALSAQALNGASQAFDFMSTDQALQSVSLMREQKIELPQDLEENIKKDPEKASELMNDAFAKIPPIKVESKEDISKQRKSVIREAEKNFGINFKDVLEQQKKMMNASEEKVKRRRGGKRK